MSTVSQACLFKDANNTNVHVSFDADHMRVLVVDDSIAIQKVMKRWLESNGCVVTIAANGKVGLALVKEQRFDITFMDFLMVNTL